MFPDGQDPYALLGVTRDSTVTEIRERYLVLAQIWHPDRHQSSPAQVREEVTRQMQQINAAYKHLTAVHTRAHQDRERQTRERQDRERDTRERQNRERDARERQARERETRERENPRAQWTHPRFEAGSGFDTSTNPRPTIHPIAITLRSGERGYTLRAHLDDQQTDAAFLGAQSRLLLFRSAESMRTYLARTEAHELATIAGWDSFLDGMGSTPTEPDDEHSFDFDLITYSLRFPPAQWVPTLFIANRDLIREVSEAFELGDVLKQLAVGSPLDYLDDLFRVVDRPVAGWGARRQLASLQAGRFSGGWRGAIAGVEERVRWLR
ncbi:DnaJ domain-containing protein [Micromonospora coriariae]|uniref:DnaJ domain-containing protein n=1 Tax=Micromonospora coriariae TaxID=285665 RepID=A0A1C4UZT1_9ACTN|nr:J domain-containing protein [Micromonospora coriariae]SCE77212.1 DnaJ domain-containing protein [Micromonospora coriariae]